MAKKSQQNTGLKLPTEKDGFIFDQTSFEETYKQNATSWKTTFQQPEGLESLSKIENINGHNFPKTENVLIAPYRYICKLLLKHSSGHVFGGTGVY